MPEDPIAPTARTQVRRLPERGHYDRPLIHAILDEGFFCHVGFVVEGAPVVIPTGYGRRGEDIYFHGSAASRMLRVLQQGAEVCLTVTLVDGLVLARSAFHHSMNYRSVVVMGRARLVAEEGEKLQALEVITSHIVAGRWAAVRAPTQQELKATTVLALPIGEASAKVRTGPPKDDAGDYGLPFWAGVVPVRLEFGAAQPDPQLAPGVATPGHVSIRRSRPV